MLQSLSIRNVVLIDRLDLSFGGGLCVFTGETGAGKSIVLDALGLALGMRAEARLVRAGCAEASVAARFAIAADHEVCALLREHALDGGEEGVVLRRHLGSDGRSRAFVNDQPVSVGLLRRVGDMLVEVHGQFESQRLLDASVHRDLLDLFGGLEAEATACRTAWSAWRTAEAAFADAQARMRAAQRDEEYLRHASEELDEADPRLGEEDLLSEERTLLSNVEKLLQTMQEASAELTAAAGGRAVVDALRSASRHLQRIADKAPGRLDEVISALERAVAEAEEAEALLRRVASSADLDPRRLEQVEERLFALRALARKHNTTVDGLVGLREEIAAKLASIESGAGDVAELDRARGRAATEYAAAAEKLSERRRDAAARLDQMVAAELGPLRLGSARFITAIEPLRETEWGPAGRDRVSFEVVTVPGMPPGPLARIASGGELARFMLALKVVLARADPVPTLVFDEVDAGIGGAVAAAVGERLAILGRDVQVVVVTHSPQVAARGQHHWRIRKAAGEAGLRTLVEVLDSQARREEIARMLAGARITDEARAAAESLLSAAHA